MDVQRPHSDVRTPDPVGIGNEGGDIDLGELFFRTGGPNVDASKRVLRDLANQFVGPIVAGFDRQ